MDYTKEERKRGGVYDADTDIISGVLSHDAGYIDQKLEKIVGIQTDKLFKRAIIPYGGIRMAVMANKAYGYKVSDRIIDIFSNYRKTHNQGVYDAYDAEIRQARRTGIITGLPDTYGRGRIIGDYRKLALYGADALIQDKKDQFTQVGMVFSEDMARRREEINEEIRALQDIKKLAELYNFDVSLPSQTAQDAAQAIYIAYLAVIKQNNGAAMSFGRAEAFLDIYFERDLAAGIITESEAQEIIDHLVMKLRIVKFMRPEEYNALFSGDPI
jgi:formate C-acetyltransferase